MPRLTKREALAQFRELWADTLQHEPNWKGDAIAKRESWNNWTDSLCKGGEISNHQYNTWANPF